MTAKTAGIISSACAIAAGIGLYSVVGYYSILVGLAILCAVFFVLACINAYVLNGGKTESRQSDPAVNEIQVVSERDEDAAFMIVTVVSLIGGIALGIWVNSLIGESSILTWIGGWIVVEFAAIIFSALFRKPRKIGIRQALQEDLEEEIFELKRKKRKEIESNSQEDYAYDSLLSARPCGECGERYCLDLVRDGNGYSSIRCSNCFVIQGLDDVINAEPPFLLTALRELFEQGEFCTALRLLHELLEHQTLDEIGDTDPMVFSYILEELLYQDECSVALQMLHEISRHGSGWAAPLASFFKQYERSVGVEYPTSKCPDPKKLVHAFSVLLDDVSNVAEKRAEEQLAIFELSLDLYARMESNCIEGLREYFSRVTCAADKNGFALAPLEDVATLLEPFEESDAELSEKAELLGDKLDSLMLGEEYRGRIELLKARYSVLFAKHSRAAPENQPVVR